MKLRKLKIKYYKLLVKNKKQDLELGEIVKALKKYELEALRLKVKTSEVTTMRNIKEILVAMLKETILQAKVEVRQEEVERWKEHTEKLDSLTDSLKQNKPK